MPPRATLLGLPTNLINDLLAAKVKAMNAQSKKKRRKKRAIKLEIRAGTTGYRAQLDRTHRFLARVLSFGPHPYPIEYQDDVWAFFQNCWHLTDWVENDSELKSDLRKRIRKAWLASTLLNMVCRDMANGTKHLALRKRRRPRAAHAHLRITRYVDCLIDTPTGQRSARDVARECVNEWIQILTAVNLPTNPRPY